MSNEPTRIVTCPNCGKPVSWSSTNRHRPFCSERCRLIDFGGWASESHRITGDDHDDLLSEDLDEPR